MSSFDHLNLFDLREEPTFWEEAITQLHHRYDSDPEAKLLLESCYLEPDRERAFQRFHGSREFAAIRRIIEITGADTDTGILEVGGGPGFLSAALNETYGSPVDLLEPSSETVTGTGYLQSRRPVGVTVWNDLSAWHKAPKSYPFLITRNCIHHFRNIGYVSAILRQKLLPGALWVAVRESYVETAEELYSRLEDHPLSQKFRLYEWFYPSHHYVEAIELSGFSLQAVVPAGYDDDCLSCFAEDHPDATTQERTAAFDELLANDPGETVRRFWAELDANRRGGRQGLYTRAQAFVFRRISIA